MYLNSRRQNELIAAYFTNKVRFKYSFKELIDRNPTIHIENILEFLAFVDLKREGSDFYFSGATNFGLKMILKLFPNFKYEDVVGLLEDCTGGNGGIGNTKLTALFNLMMVNEDVNDIYSSFGIYSLINNRCDRLGVDFSSPNDVLKNHNIISAFVWGLIKNHIVKCNNNNVSFDCFITASGGFLHNKKIFFSMVQQQSSNQLFTKFDAGLAVDAKDVQGE